IADHADHRLGHDIPLTLTVLATICAGACFSPRAAARLVSACEGKNFSSISMIWQIMPRRSGRINCDAPAWPCSSHRSDRIEAQAAAARRRHPASLRS
ncbi:MAG: hypothetical protein J0H75_07555, partial [Rhizobiales bacterium]|nr:hypothetical protein [Hyphomicrobiales bacterium]